MTDTSKFPDPTYRDTVLAVRGVLDHDQVAALHEALAGGTAD